MSITAKTDIKNKARNKDWIVVNYETKPAIMLCERCGTFDDFPSYHPINYVSDVIHAFIKAHRNCKDKK